MAWLIFFLATVGILSTCVWAGYCMGRDSHIHEIEDRADDRVYAARETYRKAFCEEAAALRKAHLKDLHELFDAVEAAFETKMPQRFEPFIGPCGEPKQ